MIDRLIAESPLFVNFDTLHESYKNKCKEHRVIYREEDFDILFSYLLKTFDSNRATELIADSDLSPSYRNINVIFVSFGLTEIYSIFRNAYLQKMSVVKYISKI